MPGETITPWDFGTTHAQVVDNEDLKLFLDDTEPDGGIKTKQQQSTSTTTTSTTTKMAEQSRQLSADDILGDENKDDDNSTEDDNEESNEEDKTKTKGNEGEEEDDNIYSSIAEELFTQGLFIKEEDEDEIVIETPEQLLERFQFETKKQAGGVIDKFLTKYGDDYKDMFHAVFVDGVAPQQYLQRFTRIQDIASVDLADEANQERIVRELYVLQGRKDVSAKIEKLKGYGDLEQEAKEAKEILLTKEQEDMKNDVQRKQEEEDRKKQIKTEYFTAVSRILNDKIKAKQFDSIPVSAQFAQEVGQYITKEKWQTKKGEYLTDFDKDVLDLGKPENYELKVKVAMLLRMLKQDPSLSKLSKKAVSEETNTVFNKLKKHSLKSSDNKDKKKEETKNSSWFSKE